MSKTLIFIEDENLPEKYNEKDKIFSFTLKSHNYLNGKKINHEMKVQSFYSLNRRLAGFGVLTSGLISSLGSLAPKFFWNPSSKDVWEKSLEF